MTSKFICPDAFISPLVIEDEQGKKEEAINAFKKLIFQDKVLMVFGPTLSNSAQAAATTAGTLRL